MHAIKDGSCNAWQTRADVQAKERAAQVLHN